MLDWHSCQICYPLEIKILLFFTPTSFALIFLDISSIFAPWIAIDCLPAPTDVFLPLGEPTPAESGERLYVSFTLKVPLGLLSGVGRSIERKDLLLFCDSGLITSSLEACGFGPEK